MSAQLGKLVLAQDGSELFTGGLADQLAGPELRAWLSASLDGLVLQARHPWGLAAGGGPLQSGSGLPGIVLVDVEAMAPIDGGEAAIAVAVGELPAERQVERAVAVLVEATRLLLDARDERELCQGICELVVRDGRFGCAWVQPDGAAGDPVAAAGDPSCLGLPPDLAVPVPLDGDAVWSLCVAAADGAGIDEGVRDVLGVLGEDLGYGLRTLRERDELALAAERLDALMRASGIYVFAIEDGQHGAELSPAFARLLGSSQLTREHVHPDDLAAALAAWDGGGGDLPGHAAAVPLRLRDATGTWRRMSIAVSRYEAPEAGRSGRIAVLADVTGELDAQAQLAAAARLDAVAALAAGVASDVKGLLVAMVGSAALLADSESEEGREVQATLGRAARDANRLLRRLVEVGRDAPGAREVVDLNEVVDGVVRITKAITHPGHRLVVDYAGEPVLAVVERLELERAIVNLVKNADEAIDGHGTVTVRVLPDEGGRVGIAVEDDGSGIPPEVLEHLWDPFFTTKPEGVGTGLGLPSARSVVAAAGGTIEVRTQVGHGSAFTILLPPVTA